MKKFRYILVTVLITAACTTSKKSDLGDDVVNEPVHENTEIGNERSATSDSVVVDSVNRTTAGGNTDRYLQFETYLASEEGIAPDEIQVIDSMCALSVWPSEAQLDNKKRGIQSEEEQDEFETAADDFGYYMYKATTNIETLQIKVIDVKKRYLKLKGPHTTWLLDIRKEGAPQWNIIFFNISKEPQVVSYWEIAEDEAKLKIRQYFDLK